MVENNNERNSPENNIDNSKRKDLKPDFWEGLKLITLSGINYLFRKLGPVGTFFIIVAYYIDRWAKADTKDLIVQKYVLNVDKLPGTISQCGVIGILNVLLIIIITCILLLKNAKIKKLQKEMDRISGEKRELQEKLVGRLERSG